MNFMILVISLSNHAGLLQSLPHSSPTHFLQFQLDLCQLKMDYILRKLSTLTKTKTTSRHYSISQEYCEGLGLKNVALRSHQLEGLKWLSECHERGQRGCILGDEMGLGKTLQVGIVINEMIIIILLKILAICQGSGHVKLHILYDYLSGNLYRPC